MATSSGAERGHGNSGGLPGGTRVLAATQPAVDGPLATNSWARRTILARAQMLGLPPEVARQVANLGLWYYNRLVLKLNRKGSADQELPQGTNRYLVPITLAFALEDHGHTADLERLLRLSGIPSRRTVEHAHELHLRYRSILGADGRTSRRPGPSVNVSQRVAPRSPGPVTDPNVRARSDLPRVAASTQAPAGGSRAPLNVPLVVRIAGSNGRGPNGSGAAAKMRQITTNNWARRRITDLGRSLELPEPVRRRSLELYERIVDLHTPKDLLPPGKRRQLSPRLNWSLVYTTVYLACRVEEHPKDLRDILGPNAKPGALREMYRLYRFYKRQLRLSIKLLDVKTFIQSWIDGFELSELAFEKATPGENERLKVRAVRIASRARGDRSLRDTSTKVIAAGALTTALAERERPGNLSRFYRAIAEFLHMSEETIRLIVGRITAIM